MSKFWDVARWFVDPVGSLGSLLSRSGTNSDKFDFTPADLRGFWDDWTGNTANRENIAYQKEYNEQVFNRGDTQYQRTVADLRASGLSAQLAAGAPSTVAGASAAPQRTVGNESAAIERLVGLVNSIKQTNSNVALAGAQADAAKAEASDNIASANLKNAQLGDYSERMSIDMSLKQSQIAYNSALTQIAQLEGQSYANRIQSKLDYEASQTSYNNALIKLAQSQIDVATSTVELNKAKASESSAQRDHINQATKNLIAEHDNLVQELSNKIKYGLKLDAETDLLVKQVASAQIANDIAIYNFDYSMGNNLRTTDGLPTLFGSAPQWIGSTLGKMNNTIYTEWKNRFESSLSEFHSKNDKPAQRDLYSIPEIIQIISDWNNQWTPINWLFN